MSEFPTRRNVPYGLQASYASFYKQSQAREENPVQTGDVFAKALPFPGSQTSKEEKLQEEIIRFLKNARIDAELLNSPILPPLVKFTLRFMVYMRRFQSTSREKSLVYLFRKAINIVICVVCRGDAPVIEREVSELCKIVGLEPLSSFTEFQAYLASAINGVIASLSQCPVETRTEENIRKCVQAVLIFFRQERPSDSRGEEEEVKDAAGTGDDFSTKKVMKTRASTGTIRDRAGGVLTDCANFYTEEEQETAAALSVTGINYNVPSGWMEELSALVPGLSSSLSKATKGNHLTGWDAECLQILAVGLQNRVANLIDTTKEIAVKRFIELEETNQFRQEEKQDPQKELDEIRKEELRQIEAVAEASRSRLENEEEQKLSQYSEVSSKRRLSDSTHDMTEGLKRPRKRQSFITNPSDAVQKTNEALSSSIQGLLKKRREQQARMSHLKHVEKAGSHTVLPSSQSLTSQDLMRRDNLSSNISTISLRDLLFVLERETLCSKSMWFYNKFNLLGSKMQAVER
eukprot:jgi/Galph1/6065/GphlegSOOS_G4718.1